MNIPKILDGIDDGEIIKYTDTKITGIYFLIDKGKIVYIGKSEDIPSRIECHRKNNEIIFVSAYYIRCNKEDLYSIEAKYITKYGPKYNVAGKDQYYRNQYREMASRLESNRKIIAENRKLAKGA